MNTEKKQSDEKKKQAFRPENLRTLLALILFVLVLGGGGLFYLQLNSLKTYSTEVNQALADADAKEKQISDLQVLKSQLAQSNQLIAKADQMFSTEDTYQAQMLNDIRQYVDAAGLTIASTSFESGTSHVIIVKLLSPVDYNKLLLFLDNVETSLPKLRVTSITISRPTDSNADTSLVTVGDIKIEASVR